MSLGYLREFKLGQSDWETFKSRLDDYFQMNSIVKPNQLKGLFLNALDDDAYNLLCSLCAPQILQSQTYEDLLSIFDSYFSLNTAFPGRMQFNSASKAPNESCTDWLRRLRNLAKHCKFGDELNVMIRDRFIMGMEVPIRNRLFEEDIAKLTLEKSLEIALQMESNAIEEHKIVTFRAIRSKKSNRSSSPYYRKVYSVLPGSSV